MPDFLRVQHNLLELTSLGEALNDLVGYVGPQVDRQRQSWVDTLDKISEFLAAFQLQNTNINVLQKCSISVCKSGLELPEIFLILILITHPLMRPLLFYSQYKVKSFLPLFTPLSRSLSICGIFTFETLVTIIQELHCTV